MDNSNAALLARYQYVIVAAAIIVLAAGAILLLWQRPDPAVITIVPPPPTVVPSATPIPSPTSTPGPYIVYVTGAVLTPEAIVTVPFGSRVMDAVAAAGGADEMADLSRVNLAAVVMDGDHIAVPTREAAAERRSEPVRVVTSTPGQITVYVTGAVAQPHTLVSVPIGSRVEDAVREAGGLAADADLDRVNLGQMLSDGDLIYVPPVDARSVELPTPNRPRQIYVNHADAATLETLPGVGPTLAQAIIEYRTEHGHFAQLEDLDAVPGIGPSKLADLREFVVFDVVE